MLFYSQIILKINFPFLKSTPPKLGVAQLRHR